MFYRSIFFDNFLFNSHEILQKTNFIIVIIYEIHYIIEEFSAICGISSREMSNIKNRTVDDIKFSTFVKLCENGGISYIDIFGCRDCEVFEREIQKFILTDGERQYSISRK